MKTLLAQTQNINVKALSFISFIMIGLLAFNPIYAQNSASAQVTVKGIVSDESGPLPGVNIVLKGTKTGAITDSKGEFTFPKTLAVGDVLVFSYLGYENHEIKIKSDSTFIRLTLTEDLIEMMGAPASDKPYKSKRRH
ncbi:carboxypeptidase-like regulatory domain-containing protein [Ichthyenterobacterium sp. W332]|uniref:Carboxypeptidase-like regulatory domain-containing protein n=1 Tax=Microcosmobacter mediterraneus TaxID=3075607 RepID=A0ABU2YK52_9FLAO|nr:carboxypeptidase-like regulatory domain-containing protein [Ichthyenterobacterium sp. W332]MDT0558526.1 carboxypeptidase-like regulatory domain-containing protein [Ichthyenterobacterium sp. W332]